MKRTWVVALAGLALLAQSGSMAWASTQRAAADASAGAEHSMPCHGDETGSGANPDCCNGDCIFMSGGAPLPAAPAAPPVPSNENHFPAAPVPALLASHSLSPFRPPAI